MTCNLGILIVIATKIFVIFGQELSEKDYEIMEISIDDNGLHKNASRDDYKAILRYGFQQTDDCQVFEKAYVCVRKCLDFGYQIAKSDKKCRCRCYKNRVLASYKSKRPSTVTSWKLGAPTTTRPSWEKVISKVKVVKPISGKELFADLVANNNDYLSGNSTSKGEGGKGNSDAFEGKGEAQTGGKGEAQTDGEGEAHHGGEDEGEASGEDEGEASGEDEASGEGEAYHEGEDEAEAGGKGEGEASGEGEAHHEGDSEAHHEGEGEAEAEGEGEASSEGEAHHESEGEAHHEGEGEAHHEGEGEAHHEGEGEAHHEGEGEAHHKGESGAEAGGEAAAGSEEEAEAEAA